jgi:hypothetical protein
MNTRTDSRDRPTVRGWVSGFLSNVLPPFLRTKFISVSIEVPSQIQQDQPTEFRISIRNWLPIPITLHTGARPWYWHIDGIHDADSTEPDPQGALLEDTTAFEFDPFECKRITKVWNGRLRTDENGSYLPVDHGEHVIGVTVTAKTGDNLTASQTFEVIPQSDHDQQRHPTDAA